MSTLTREHMEAIERLPEGATLVLQQLSWNDYEFLLEDLMAAHRHRRVTYDRGRLEVMSPLNKHERFARLIDDLVRAFADRFSITLEKLGETTWRRRTLEQGLEADCCYYVKNADRVIGKERIDLEVDPPPDIAVEIDITNESLSKFHIYAALKVREIWRYDGQTIQFYELGRNSYRKTAESSALPGLKPRMLADALEQSKIEGQTEALASFRKALG